MALPAFDLAACAASSWQLPPDALLRLPVIAGGLLVAGWAAAQRFFPGQRAFVALHAAMLAWLAVSGLEHAALAPGCRVSLALLQWPAIVAVPTLWAVFLVRHAGSHARPLPPAWQVVLALPVLGYAVIALGNGELGWLYRAAGSVNADAAGRLRMHYERGPAFYAAAAWSYLLLLAGTVQVWVTARQSSGRARTQWLAFGMLAAVPWAANIAYVVFGWRLLGVDPTPLSFAVGIAGFAWLIRASALFDIVPLARGLLFDELPDAVLVADPEGRVIDSNAAARALAGDTPPPGTPLAAWPRIGPPLAAALAQPQPVPPFELPGSGRIIELRQRPLGEPPRQLGRLLQLRDITAQQHAQTRVVQALAERNAQLQQVASLQAELREQALRDPLTGLMNRRALAQRFEAHAAHATPPQPLLALVLIDIDHFKRINDSGGHAAGDELLRRFGALLRERLRSGDSVFRVGGEEFALLLPGADAEQAVQRVQAIAAQWRARSPHSAAGVVTFSAGVAEWPRDGSGLDALLHAADQALYRAKAQGRDRVLATAA